MSTSHVHCPWCNDTGWDDWEGWPYPCGTALTVDVLEESVPSEPAAETQASSDSDTQSTMSHIPSEIAPAAAAQLCNYLGENL
jgi:hypothetical protein